MGGAQDFREGDRAWPGAAIVELPDLSAVRLTARLDEADRGRVEVGQPASVHLDAVPDRVYESKVASISLLARVDFSTNWPPARDFDIQLAMGDPDSRLRPGMSATVRIAVARLPDVLLVPAQAVSLVNGRPTVYVQTSSGFDAAAGRDREARARAGGARVWRGAGRARWRWAIPPRACRRAVASSVRSAHEGETTGLGGGRGGHHRRRGCCGIRDQVRPDGGAAHADGARHPRVAQARRLDDGGVAGRPASCRSPRPRPAGGCG